MRVCQGRSPVGLCACAAQIKLCFGAGFERLVDVGKNLGQRGEVSAVADGQACRNLFGVGTLKSGGEDFLQIQIAGDVQGRAVLDHAGERIGDAFADVLRRRTTGGSARNQRAQRGEQCGNLTARSQDLYAFCRARCRFAHRIVVQQSSGVGDVSQAQDLGNSGGGSLQLGLRWCATSGLLACYAGNQCGQGRQHHIHALRGSL